LTRPVPHRSLAEWNAIAQQTVLALWQAAETNDFAYASTFLHDDFEYFMPQTHEFFEGETPLPP